MLAQAIKRGAGVRGNASPEDALAGLRAWVRPQTDDPDLATWALARALRMPTPPRPSNAPHRPEAVHDLATELLLGRLQARAEDGGLLIVLAAAQWADRASLDFLALAMDRLRDCPLALVFTQEGTSSPRPGWLPSGAHLVTLEPVALDEARSLARSCLPEGSDAAIEAVARRSGGEPWRISALCWLSREGHPPDALPNDPVTTVAARLQGLEPAVRAVAQVAAAIGESQSFQALDHIVRGASRTLPSLPWPDQLRAAVDTLVAEGILERRVGALSAYEWYRFRSEPIRRGLLQSTPVTARAGLHRILAAWLERLVADRGSEWLASVAGTWEAGGRPDRAAALYREAAERTARTGAMADAGALYRRALAVGLTDPAERARIQLAAARLLEREGRWDRALRTLDRAERDALRAGQHTTAVECLLLRARICTTRGAFAEAEDHASRALHQARHNAPALRSRAMRALGTARGRMGHNADARRLREEAAELDSSSEDPAVQALALGHRAWRCVDDGHPNQAEKLWKEAAERFRALNHPSDEADALHSLGILYQGEGRIDEARRSFERSLELRRQELDRPRQAWNLHNLAHLHRDQGDLATAEALQAEEIAISRQVGNLPGVGYGLYNAAMNHEHRGDYDRAERLLVEALAIFEQVGEPERVQFIQLQRARVARLGGDLERAATWLDAAGSPPAEALALALARLDTTGAEALASTLEPGSLTEALMVVRALDLTGDALQDAVARWEHDQRLGPSLELAVLRGQTTATEALAAARGASAAVRARLAGLAEDRP